MGTTISTLTALLIGFGLDRIYGDPAHLPHPVVGFGKAIAWFEKRMNTGNKRLLKGTFTSLFLVLGSYAGSYFMLKLFTEISIFTEILFNSLVVFFCLAGLTLRKEVRDVFRALDDSTEKGRQQLSRIVGRDTSRLSPQQIRTAALETLSENLSDGVIAPLFWFGLLGAPGIIAYKMINTLDSMIGYKNERYLLYGRFAARLDDAVNYIPARLTAFIMLLVAGDLRTISTVFKQGKLHASPNSGYPEAALADILQCQFGGPNYYFGQLVEKPYIGTNPKEITNDDLDKAIRINSRSEIVMVAFTAILCFLAQQITAHVCATI